MLQQLAKRVLLEVESESRQLSNKAKKKKVCLNYLHVLFVLLLAENVHIKALCNRAALL